MSRNPEKISSESREHLRAVMYGSKYFIIAVNQEPPVKFRDGLIVRVFLVSRAKILGAVEVMTQL